MGSTVCLTESTPRLLFLPVHPEAKLQPRVWRGSADVCGSASRLLGGMGERRKLVVLCAALPFMHPSGMCRCCRAGNVAGIARLFDG